MTDCIVSLELLYNYFFSTNGHPTQKPLQLMERCITIWTNENDTILDFTMGSGTTGEAALKLNRKFIGIEQNKQWFDITEKRLTGVINNE